MPFSQPVENVQVTGGSITIANPVQILGGGDALIVSNAAFLDGTSPTLINIPAPTLNFPSFMLEVAISEASPAPVPAGTVFRVRLVDNAGLELFNTYLPFNGAGIAPDTAKIRVFIPNITNNYPLQLLIRAENAAAGQDAIAQYSLSGTSVTPDRVTGKALISPIVKGYGAAFTTMLPSAPEVYRVRLQTSPAGGSNITASAVDVWDENAGAWATSLSNPHIPLNYALPAATPTTLPVATPVEFLAGGDKYARRLRVTAQVNAVSVSILPL